MTKQASGEIIKSDSRKLNWVKLSVSCFDDEKIRLIESMPDGDTLLVIWFKLLAQAGRSNASGYIVISETIPFTPEVMAKLFTRTEQQIRYALSTFEKMGMIEMRSQGVFICNFMKHHSEISKNASGLKRVHLCRMRKRLAANGTQKLQNDAVETVVSTDDQTWEWRFLKDLKATGKCPSLTLEGLKMVTKNYDALKLSKNWGEIVVEARDHSDHVLNNPTAWLRSAISRMETRLIIRDEKEQEGSDKTKRRAADLVRTPEGLNIGGAK